MEEKIVTVIGKKRDYVAKDKSGKIYFIKSNFDLRKGFDVRIQVIKEMPNYGFGRVLWQCKEIMEECYLVSEDQRILITQENINKIRNNNLRLKCIELLNKIKKEREKAEIEYQKKLKEFYKIDKQIREAKSKIKTREYVLSKNEVVKREFPGVPFGVHGGMFGGGTYYESLRGKRIEELEEEVAEKMFGESYSLLLEVFSEDLDIEAGKKILEVIKYIANNYIKEHQIYVDENGKEWEFERFVRKKFT